MNHKTQPMQVEILEALSHSIGLIEGIVLARQKELARTITKELSAKTLLIEDSNGEDLAVLFPLDAADIVSKHLEV